jgi:hypothetical protein
MSSHYIKCYVESSFEKVFEALSLAFGNLYAKKFNGDGHFRGVILGEEYFFRVNSDVALLILLEERSAGEVEIEIISYAGGTGLFEISYSAHSTYAHKVKDFLTSSGFKIEVKEEIPYFSNYRLRTK